MGNERTVYFLTDPRNGQTRYIGQSGDVSSRLLQHRRTRTPVQEWMHELDAARVALHLTTLPVPASHALAIEAEFIGMLTLLGHPLLNGMPHRAMGTKEFHIDADLHAEAKASAATQRMSLRAWAEAAFRAMLGRLRKRTPGRSA